MKDATFSSARLLELYDRISDSEDAIPRLRRFVLDLAVRGKLVEQDAGDEPAAELLKRIAQEKARLVREGGFKSLDFDANELPIVEPFELPKTWAWCFLDDIAGIARGGSPRPIKAFLTDAADGIPWIKIGDSTRGSIYINSTDERIKPEGVSRSRLVVPGDLLLSNSMSFGYPYITNISGCIHDGWLVIRTPAEQISKLYIHTMFLSNYAKDAFSEAAAGAVVQNLNADKVRRLLLPLPPLAEQRRIVAKVDELMALCDQLEQARAGREAVRDRLTTASLARLTAPDTDAETFPTHARFALQSLPTLTTRPDQIKTLRQTILNLAVRGKLVAQNPADEPAADLLKRIAAEKARLAKAGEIGPMKSVPALDEDDLPFSIPQGWVWAQFSTIGIVSPRVRAEDSAPSSFVSMSMISAELGVPHTHEVRKWGEVKKGYTTFAEGDVGLAKITPCFENGKSTVFRRLAGGIGAGTTELHVVRPILTEPAYMLLFLKSPTFIERGIPKMTGTAGQKRVPTEYFSASPFPLPPLAEQHRIVAKVDALMALCDQLEASLTTTATTRSKLLGALLHEALEPPQQEVV